VNYGFNIEYTDVISGSEYRDLIIPAASWRSTPSCGVEPTAELMMQYITMATLIAGDGDGRLYVAEDGIDVDVAGETTEAGTALTWGDGTPDPAGSAWIHIPINSNTYGNASGPPDPAAGPGYGPGGWGAVILGVPMDLYLTTATSQNHITDGEEAMTPGVYFNCSTVNAGPGTPFAETGGPAPYVGTSATVVGTGAALDLIVMGFIELDVQYTMDVTLTPAVYDVSNMTVTETATEPDPVTVTVDVHRASGAAGPITVSLQIIDIDPLSANFMLPIYTEDQTTASLAVCNTETVTFTWNPSTAGIYRAIVDYLQDQFVVAP